MSVHQGASEESTFWLLACSGALLSQRDVLVAARCVLDKDTLRSLQPAQVRVVLGTQYQASTDRLKTLPHLRVRRALLVRKSIESFVLFFYLFLHFAAQLHVSTPPTLHRYRYCRYLDSVVF